MIEVQFLDRLDAAGPDAAGESLSRAENVLDGSGAHGSDLAAVVGSGDDPGEQRERLAQLLKQAAEITLRTAGAGDDLDLTLAVGDDAYLQELNRRFLDIDTPTDVLSFPSGETDPETGRLYLGDVILSLERAAVQASAGGHPLADELQLLVVHGVLHLLGHDHADDGQKAAMWALQQSALEALGCPLQP